ncbi:hypothetical protein HYR69_05755 [Candidatus Sumerlaeota bacterium]|nr:hypothetical protein [Candidatus Sumerlaeota bacterium]
MPDFNAADRALIEAQQYDPNIRPGERSAGHATIDLVCVHAEGRGQKRDFLNQSGGIEYALMNLSTVRRCG